MNNRGGRSRGVYSVYLRGVYGGRRGRADRARERCVAAAAQGGGAGPDRGLSGAAGDGGALPADGPPPDGAARPRRVRQDRLARASAAGRFANGALRSRGSRSTRRMARARLRSYLALAFEAAGLGDLRGTAGDARGRRLRAGAGASKPTRRPTTGSTCWCATLGAPQRAVCARTRRGGAAREPGGGGDAQRAASPRAAQSACGDGVPREQPPGLDIAMFALEGREATVTVEDLRFSRPGHRAVLRRGGCRAGSWPRWPPTRRGGRSRYASTATPGVGTSGRGRRGRGAHGGGVDRDAAVARHGGRGPRPRAGRRAVRQSGPGPARRGGSGCGARRGGSRRWARSRGSCRPEAAAGRRCSFTPSSGTGASGGASRRARTGSGRYTADIARALTRRARFVEALRHAGEAGDAALLGELGERTGGVQAVAPSRAWRRCAAVDGLLSDGGAVRSIRALRWCAAWRSRSRATSRGRGASTAAAERGDGGLRARPRGRRRPGAAHRPPAGVRPGRDVRLPCRTGRSPRRLLPLGHGRGRGGQTPGRCFTACSAWGSALTYNQGTGVRCGGGVGRSTRGPRSGAARRISHTSTSSSVRSPWRRGRAGEAQACYERALRGGAGRATCATRAR